MKRYTVFAALSGLALMSACAPEISNEPVGSEQSAIAAGTRNHVMKVQPPVFRNVINYGPPAGSHLNYYGGPVLTNVNVIPVYWNANVAFQANLNAFYAAVPNSAYYDMLSQYSGIGRGTRGTPFVDTQGTGNLTDAQIQAELTALFNAGRIPGPTVNNYYPIHFPASVSITSSQGDHSCVSGGICAYHGTYVYNGINVNYGVIPDQGGGCASICGANSQRVNNLTSVSSHELVEATTDPAVGLAATIAAPLAWYDPAYQHGEIGDLCNHQQATITGGDGNSYVVQKEFSNLVNDCVVSPPPLSAQLSGPSSEALHQSSMYTAIVGNGTQPYQYWWSMRFHSPASGWSGWSSAYQGSQTNYASINSCGFDEFQLSVQVIDANNQSATAYEIVTITNPC